MKKIIFLFTLLFFYACSNTSSNFVHFSLPNFKPQVSANTDNIEKSGIKVKLSDIKIDQNSDYSEDFRQSVLNIRINKEIELLKENTKEQISTILALKGYEINNEIYDYELNTSINIFIKEDNLSQSSQFFNGQSIESDLIIIFDANIDFVNAKDSQDFQKIATNTKLDSGIKIIYPIKSEDGITMFKTSLSSVPTQLNKGLEEPAFNIDKAFLSFYKSTLNTLYNNIPQANTLKKEEDKKEYNDFNQESIQEQNSSKEEIIIVE